MPGELSLPEELASIRIPWGHPFATESLTSYIEGTRTPVQLGSRVRVEYSHPDIADEGIATGVWLTRTVSRWGSCLVPRASCVRRARRSAGTPRCERPAPNNRADTRPSTRSPYGELAALLLDPAGQAIDASRSKPPSRSVRRTTPRRSPGSENECPRSEPRSAA